MRYLMLMVLIGAASVHGQTVGVVGVNDYTLNQEGSGATSCHPITLPFGPQILNFRITGTPQDQVVLVAGQCALGFVSLVDGTALDIDLSAGFLFDSSGMFAAPLNFPFFTGVNGNGDWALSISGELAGGVSLTTQAALLGPSHPGGITMTQAHVATAAFPPMSVFPSTVGGDLVPLSEDSNVFVSLPLPFVFYGVPYTFLRINMNGNATFVAGDPTFTPTEFQMLAGPPRIAPAWDDWSPQDPTQGTVRAFTDASVFQCEWFDVRHFGCAGVGDTNTFGFELAFATGEITFRYDTLLLCNALIGSFDQIVGVSPGNGLSGMNNGDFWSGGPSVHAGFLPFDAVYEDFSAGFFGPFDLGNGGSSGISFVPSGGTFIATSF